MEIADGRNLSLIVLIVEAILFIVVVGVVSVFAIRGVRQSKFHARRGLRRGQRVMDDVEGFVTRHARSPFAWVVTLAGLVYRVFLVARRAVGRFGGG